jgi:hypothetical protein
MHHGSGKVVTRKEREKSNMGRERERTSSIYI